MNNDLISREALKKALEEDMNYGGVKIDEFDKGYDLGIKSAIEMLDNAPTVPYITKEKLSVAYDQGFEDGQKRPHGEWITVRFAFGELNAPEKSKLDFVKCPFCETIHQGRHNFCSYCGADMKGGDANDT